MMLARASALIGTEMNWETVIGLEIHAQLATRSKIFSGASTAFGAAPNTQACAGRPRATRACCRCSTPRRCAWRSSSASRSAPTIAPRSVFARKNYFYPDLPKGYQISQYELPIVHGGSLDIDARGRRDARRIGITRAHLEEDAGKSLHEDFHGAVRHRPEPRRHAAARDRLRARHALGRRGGRLHEASCTRWCAISTSATATCRKARSAATPTSRCAARAEQASARAPRSRT